MPNVGILLASAFHAARGKYQDVNRIWIQISFSIGSRLPASLLSMAIQRDGEVDLVLRCIGDEIAATFEKKESDEHFVGNYLNLMSTYWIGSFYETFRLLKERELVDGSELFLSIFRKLELLRIPLEKHEIAKDRALKEPLHLVRNPPQDNASDAYVYMREDKNRSHIMPMGVSSRGSMMWQVTDLKENVSYWVERRELSDQMLELWKAKQA